MKKNIVLFLIPALLSLSVLRAQSSNSVEFELRQVPTSTSEYKFIIKKNSVELINQELILTGSGNSRKVKETKRSAYTHKFSSKQAAILDSIIRTHQLDSVGLYANRPTQWGKLWKVKIIRDSITYYLDLPNYHNPGLESLLNFVNSVIPDKEKGRFHGE